jgi:ACS family hexuronate transporter-like MFS transporter
MRDTAMQSAHVATYRWRVCALLFAATTINYVDRQVLGVLAPDLGRLIGWSEIEYGYIVTAFQAAYAVGLVFAGAVIDRLGTRIGYALAICIWSAAAMSHALVRTALGFGVARFVLGLGEAGNFPAAIKTVAEWFPRRERALATGLFNAGSNVGAIVAALMVPIVAGRWGWRYAFLFTGVLSAIWLGVWLTGYRSPTQQPAVSKIPWLHLFGIRQTWAFVIAKFMTDPIWWFYVFWLPKYLNSEFGLTLNALGPPLIAIYCMADAGSIAGGWLAASFIRRGWPINRARKTAMLVCALAVVPIVFVSMAHNLWIAVALIGLATAGHQGWSANLFTLTSDLFPQRAVASVVGLGGFAGAVGGMLIAAFTGYLLQATGSYVSVFMMAASAYLLALAAVQGIAPRLDRVDAPADPETDVA